MQEIAKIDEKGRLLIPSGIRKAAGLEIGVDVLIKLEADSVLLSAVTEKEIYKMRIVMDDSPGTLARIADLLGESGFDIIMSESRSLSRQKIAQWDITGKYAGDLSLLCDKIKGFEFVSDVIIKDGV